MDINESDQSVSRIQDLPSSKFRFSLIHLTYLISLIAAAFALFENYAISWLAGVVLFWLMIFVLQLASKPIQILFIVLGGVLVLSCMGLPRVQSVRQAARRTVCLNNARQLGLALHNYHSVRAEFPPAYKADKNGNPVHSWRVLILPEIEQVGLYRSYNFDEPWDSPGNNKVKEGWGFGVYRCPTQSKESDFTTPYKLVTGKGTAFEADKAISFSRLDLMNTVLLIEDLADPVCWTRPRDLTLEEAIELFDVNQKLVPEFVVETKFSRRLFYHRSVVLFDGSVRTVGYLEDPEQIIPYLLLEHPDKEDFDSLDFVFPVPVHTILYSGYCLLAFNVFLALLPCFWTKLHLYQPASSFVDFESQDTTLTRYFE